MFAVKKFLPLTGILFFIPFLSFYGYHPKREDPGTDTLKAAFLHPPDAARPGVYWYFMDGNLSKEGIREDLASMKKAGIGRVIFLEVNVGIPRGPVDFLSDQWYVLFRYMVQEAERLGIEITLGVGPGWSGSGGPWVTPEESMQQLVTGSVRVTGPANTLIRLPLPAPKKPYFGEGIFTPALKKQWNDFYKDVAVLAFPTPASAKKIKDIDEKALYYRAPFSSVAGVKPFLDSFSGDSLLPAAAAIPKKRIIDLTDKLQPDGTLHWAVPPGNWTIMRFVSRNNGALTRPAPVQGLGFECSKLDTAALDHHLDTYIGGMLGRIGPVDKRSPGGLKMLHLDSWEMGAQNWTPAFREEFMKRRGYDPLPFYPVYAGDIVESPEISERFLWDLRQTCKELVLDNYAGQLKKYSHGHGLGFSNEPYDMDPAADLELGAIADIPMGEFWSKGFGFNTAFSCIEAASIAHIEGEPVVQGEAFTADGNEAWKQYPGSMKDQGDWAFATGINRFFYHTFEHKPLSDSLRPGMTMGPYGVHWDRKQTWWPLVADYHRYISRCQFMLQQGKPVADILYLTPEGAPQVFLPPPSAMEGDTVLPDRRGYNFDGCSPMQLYQAAVKDNQIVFPGGASYHLLVLPAMKTMTPALLEKISTLVREGATVIGAPPLSAPGLSGFPGCDQRLRAMALQLWGGLVSPGKQETHRYGKGKVIWGDDIGVRKGNILYPEYDLTAAVLNGMGVSKDFESSAPLRYTHRVTADRDIYFVSNLTSRRVTGDCFFRTAKGAPGLWDPVTGKTRNLPEFTVRNGLTIVPLQFEPFQSFFIVFAKGVAEASPRGKNFPEETTVATIRGPWTVSFDPQEGGPGQVVFDRLADWISRTEEGIKYYSGIAVYTKDFDCPSAGDADKSRHLYLDLGSVKDMAGVRLNGQDAGVVWTAPWRVDITGLVKQKGNHLEIEVANRWPNRLIGDQRADSTKNSKKYTYTTYNPYTKDSPLLPSGLLGPVTIQLAAF